MKDPAEPLSAQARLRAGLGKGPRPAAERASAPACGAGWRM